MRSRVEQRRAPAGVAAAAGLLVATGLLLAFFIVMNTVEVEVWIGFAAAIILSLVSIPLLALATRSEPDPWVRAIIVVALGVKLLGSLARYYTQYYFYGGLADAGRYYGTGVEYAERFRFGDFSQIGDRDFIGTPATEYITGLVLTVTGPSAFAAFFVFAWLSFWGLYGFYRAFRLAVPNGDARRYAILVFFLPSLVFWASGIGKEAWVIAFLGLAAYGAAKMFTRNGGYLLTAVGLAGVALIRPHIALLAIVAITGGYVFRARGRRQPLFGPLPQAIGLIVLLAVAFVGLQQVEEFFGSDDEGDGGVVGTAERIIDDTADQTAAGGSEFDAAPVRSPQDLPVGLVTLLFRPFPNEAENAQMLLTAVESLVLMAFFVLSWRRVWGALRQVWTNPYIRMALLYTLGFVIAFAAISNFGILVRQRTQLYPFLLVILAVQPWYGRARRQYEEVVDDVPPVGPDTTPQLSPFD